MALLEDAVEVAVLPVAAVVAVVVAEVCDDQAIYYGILEAV